MSISTILEIADKSDTERLSLTRREDFLINRITRKISDRLHGLLKKASDSTELSFSLLNSDKSGAQSVREGVELTLTLFHRSCQFYLSSTLALEIVNRYLEKAPPVVDRSLNREELSVLALVVTLTISELRDDGILGIYLRDVRNLENELILTNDDLILEETNSGQLLIIRLEAVTFEQVRERAKMMLLDNSIERKVLGTLHLASLEIDAEISSFATLLCLKPGLRLRLGREVPMAIALSENLIGYGELQIENILQEL